MKNKLPLVEYVYRWVDVYTYFNYPESIKEEAYRIITENQIKLGKPHVAAATAVMIACEWQNKKFDFEWMNIITKAFRFGNREPGLWKESMKRRRKIWKL